MQYYVSDVVDILMAKFSAFISMLLDGTTLEFKISPSSLYNIDCTILRVFLKLVNLFLLIKLV